MKRNKVSPLLWLLLIPGQLLAGVFFVWIGIRLDLMIFASGEGGHGIPIFSAIFSAFTTPSSVFTPKKTTSPRPISETS